MPTTKKVAWFFMDGETRVGPKTEAEIIDLRFKGMISNETPCCSSQTERKWIPYSQTNLPTSTNYAINIVSPDKSLSWNKNKMALLYTACIIVLWIVCFTIHRQSNASVSSVTSAQTVVYGSPYSHEPLQDTQESHDVIQQEPNGNTECQSMSRENNQTSSDISCTQITEPLLLNMRGKTKSEIQTIMNVSGIQNEDTLHFALHSNNELQGALNIIFKNNQATFIYASILNNEFTWNAYSPPQNLADEFDTTTRDFTRLPYCSDFSGIPASCRQSNDNGEHQFMIMKMEGFSKQQLQDIKAAFREMSR
jgi:hypothetical protein